MKLIDVTELKTIETGILNDVVAFCNQHGVRYSLICGTLLGAVRHNGFIPWDDDIDISMPRPDYDFFVNHYRSSIYKVVNHNNTPGYCYPFAKVIDTRTYLHECNEKAQDWNGVYIDIFPIDGAPSGKLAQWFLEKKASFWCRVLLHKNISNEYPFDFTHRLIHIFLKACFCFVPVKKVVKILDRTARKNDYNSAQSIGLFVVKPFSAKKYIYPERYFDQLVSLTFEKIECKAPSNYNGLLSFLYGDYMSLPPVEKRLNHHLFKAYYKD